MNKSTSKLFPRGSEWRKWDLHIHTPLSINQEYGGDTKEVWEKFITALENLPNDVKVIGITDYYFIDGYEKVMTFKNNGRLKNIDKIFPILEFRIDTFASASESELQKINLHILFDVDENNLKSEIRSIKDEFIGNIHLSSEHETSLLSIENLTIKSSDGKLKSGFAQLIPDTKEVFKIIESDKWKDRTFIFLGYKEWNNLEKRNQLKPKKKLLYEKAKAFFTASDTDDITKKEKVLDLDGGQYKPLLHSLDIHKFSQLTKENYKCFTWLKADPTFDGLKQIIFEPQPGERVFIGERPPTYKNTSKVIDRVEIKNSKNWFGAEPILFNENLVSVIGEKGSGKTALTDFIAIAGGDFTFDEKDQASFIKKALIPTKQITETIEDCKIIIYWKNGEQDTITINKNLSNYQPKKKVKYLSQSFIEKRCWPENFEELQREIEDIIFQHIPSSDKLSETTFEELRRRKTESIEVKKAECQRNISELNKEIFSLEEDISSLKAKKKEKTELNKEQAELEAQKPKPTTDKEKEIEEKLSLLNEHKNSLNSEIANLKSHLITIENIKTKTSTLKSYVEKQLLQTKNDLKILGLNYDKIEFSIKPDYTLALGDKQKKLIEQINKLQGVGKIRRGDVKTTQEVKLDELPEEKIKDLSLSKTEEWINNLESISSIVESTRKAIKEYDSKIIKIKTRIKELEKSIVEIETVKVHEQPKKEEERNKAYKQYFKLLAEEKNSLEELYAPLKDKARAEDENQMEFFARIELNVNYFFDKARTILDFGKKGNYYRKEEVLFKTIKEIAEVIELGEVDDIASEMVKLFNSFKEDKDGKELDIHSQLRKGKKKIDFYHWIFDTTDFRVAYNIKYQGTSLELLSPGKKGVVLLLMYLVLDTENSVPLLIDQPEENLDNKSVFPSLVDYFREVKCRRQVIVITHNPNLVLNTDAEQVVVANFDAVPKSQPSRISYISGAIENSFVSKKAKIPLEKRGIREHGLDILEGGKTAFRKRRDKYGKTAE